MSGLKKRKQIILAKIEITEGTDAAPVGTNAMLIEDLDVRPMDAETRERGHVKPYFGARPQLHVGVHVSMTFAVELAGAGIAGDVPKWGPLLRACGFAETDGVADVVYQPVSEGEDSLTIYYSRDGHKHAVTGARGSVAFEFARNDYPRMRFTFLGRYVAPAAAADPTPDFAGWTAPVESNSANTTFSLHSHSPPLASLNIDQNNTVVYRELIGAQGVVISDRAVTGALVIDEPALGDKDYFAAARSGALGALQVVHGTAAGNIVTIDSAGAGGGAQLLQPTLTDQDGISQMSLNLSLLPTDAGNDELTITVE